MNDFELFQIPLQSPDFDVTPPSFVSIRLICPGKSSVNELRSGTSVNKRRTMLNKCRKHPRAIATND
jgi:hypothetical protein